MREFKFRVWGLLGKKMHEWNEIFNLPAWEIFPGTPEQRPCVVMQYTGFKDKNGKEIYEGDILKRTVSVVLYGSGEAPKKVDEVVVVEWREDYGGFYIGERELFAQLNATTDRDTLCRCTKFEKIGNIYEHPHLLEVPHEK